MIEHNQPGECSAAHWGAGSCGRGSTYKGKTSRDKGTGLKRMRTVESILFDIGQVQEKLSRRPGGSQPDKKVRVRWYERHICNLNKDKNNFIVSIGKCDLCIWPTLLSICQEQWAVQWPGTCLQMWSQTTYWACFWSMEETHPFTRKETCKPHTGRKSDSQTSCCFASVLTTERGWQLLEQSCKITVHIFEFHRR